MKLPALWEAMTVIAVVVVSTVALNVMASTPSVTSFAPDVRFVPNNRVVTLSWNTSESLGQHIMFGCITGITIKDMNSATVPCDARISVGDTNSTGSAGYVITNVSGSTRDVPITLYPTDSLGSDYDPGSLSTMVSVQTAFQPITDFSVSPLAASSSQPFTLTWTGYYSSGVNIQVSCADSIKIYSSLTSPELPCNQPIFTSDLPISGSTQLYAVNSADSPVSITATVLPEIGGNTYDATHAKSLTLPISAPFTPDPPSVTSISLSATQLLPNDALTTSWTTNNAAGANVEFSCVDGVVVSYATSTGTILLPCGKPAFLNALSAAGKTTVSIGNRNPYLARLSVYVLPEDSKGSYYMTSAKSAVATIGPAGSVYTDTSMNQTTATAPNTSSAAKTGTSVYHFLRPLQRGSRNADVTALQTFLALDSTLYPEAVVSGFYGPATERAVQRFQKKHSIAQPGATGYGSVGPKTRSVLNTLITP